MVGPVDRHSSKSCTLLPTNASDDAADSTIPRQPSSVLKIRVLFHLLTPIVYVRRSVDRLHSRYSIHTSASPPKQMQARETQFAHTIQGRMERITIQSDNCIYMSRRFSRLNCPAKQPHIFESCIQVQTRNVIMCILIHCVHSIPVRFKPAPSTINCRSTRYNTMSWLPNLAISHMTPPFNRYDPESSQRA